MCGHFQRRVLLPPIGQKSARNPGGKFRSQSQRFAAAILERIHFFRDHIGRFAQAAGQRLRFFQIPAFRPGENDRDGEPARMSRPRMRKPRHRRRKYPACRGSPWECCVPCPRLTVRAPARNGCAPFRRKFTALQHKCGWRLAETPLSAHTRNSFGLRTAQPERPHPCSSTKSRPAPMCPTI